MNQSPKPTPDSGLRDNHSRGSAGDFLKQSISPGSELSFVSAYFTVHAYAALRECLHAADHLRFLFGDPSSVTHLDKDQKQARYYVLGNERQELTLGNQLTQKQAARDCAAWIREKVEIRSVTRSAFLHGKLYHIRKDGLDQALIGSSNFTVPGLGLKPSGNNVELNLIVDSKRDVADLRVWFDELWCDDTKSSDVRDKVLAELDRLHADNAPEFIYFLTLFHLFRDYIDGAKDLDDALTRTALPDTGIWQTLYSFQKDGAKAAINKILATNGCILADSVGLGKTFTALAVIKYFELKNERVLVLCPKKLRRNWTVYRSNSSLNPFDKDRFRYDVLSHTDLSRERGDVDGIDLATINWGNYDLIVIDESHNFRNNAIREAKDPDETVRRTRYQRLMEDIIRQGIRTKVLLLSATPVNNQLADLRNQISFIAGGDVTRSDLANQSFQETLGIASVKDTTRIAQSHFTTWSKKKPEERTTKDLLQAIGGDFFKLLDGLSIARSRKQIATYYKDEMKRLGGFPKRPAPISIHPPIDLSDKFLSFEKLNEEISALTLALYHPTSFLRDDLPPATRAAYEDMALADLAATQTDNLLERDQLEDLIDEDLKFRNKQLKKLQSEVLDLEDLDDSPSLTSFSLDEFRIELLQFLESRRTELEEAPLGLYAVVPPPEKHAPPIQPGALFCLRRASQVDMKSSTGEKLNPLAPHFLVYIHEDGNVRFSFAQPKEALNLLRALAAGKSSAFTKLCAQFDAITSNGADMSHYADLVGSALHSIEATFRKRAAVNLLSGRDGLLPTAEESATADQGDWELVAWLAIVKPA